MAYIINISGDETEFSPSEGNHFGLKELQEAVGGYIQLVTLKTGKILVVDEEGLLKNLPLNTKATILAGQPIVGPAVICSADQIQ